MSWFTLDVVFSGFYFNACIMSDHSEMETWVIYFVHPKEVDLVCLRFLFVKMSILQYTYSRHLPMGY